LQRYGAGKTNRTRRTAGDEREGLRAVLTEAAHIHPLEITIALVSLRAVVIAVCTSSLLHPASSGLRYERHALVILNEHFAALSQLPTHPSSGQPRLRHYRIDLCLSLVLTSLLLEDVLKPPSPLRLRLGRQLRVYLCIQVILVRLHIIDERKTDV
jgi:hypothetical protein